MATALSGILVVKDLRVDLAVPARWSYHLPSCSIPFCSLPRPCVLRWLPRHQSGVSLADKAGVTQRTIAALVGRSQSEVSEIIKVVRCRRMTCSIAVYRAQYPSCGDGVVLRCLSWGQPCWGAERGGRGGGARAPVRPPARDGRRGCRGYYRPRARKGVEPSGPAAGPAAGRREGSGKPTSRRSVR